MPGKCTDNETPCNMQIYKILIFDDPKLNTVVTWVEIHKTS